MFYYEKLLNNNISSPRLYLRVREIQDQQLHAEKARDCGWTAAEQDHLVHLGSPAKGVEGHYPTRYEYHYM